MRKEGNCKECKLEVQGERGKNKEGCLGVLGDEAA